MIYHVKVGLIKLYTRDVSWQIMAQNRRTISKLEFNKRVRDLVSRDSNRLRQTFQKFDKEYASRMAEIHSMQEKVRHSMRNLTQEKMQARPGSEFVHVNYHRGARMESEAERGEKSSTNDHQEGGASDTRTSNTDDRMPKHNYKASLPGIQFNRSEHLEVPNRGQARRRRYSLPHPPTFLPGSPKESRALPIHVSHPRTIASPLPKEAFAKQGSPKDTSLMSNLSGSPKESLHGIHLLYPENTRRRKSDYRLSVRELPISLSRSDPMLNVKNKLSPQLDRKGHIVTSKDGTDGDDQNINTDPVNDETTDDHEDSCDKDFQSPGGSHITLQRQPVTDHGVETERPKGNDSNHVKPKTLLKRTRSSSVPCDPDRLSLQPMDNIRTVESRPSRSANHAAGTKRDVSPAIRVVTPQGDMDTSSKPFQELRNCRYLRNSHMES